MARLAFWTGLLSVLVLLVTVVVGGASDPGYSHVANYISELGASGALHARIVSWLGFIPSGLLLLVFGVTAPLTLPRSSWTWIGFASITYYAIGLVAAGLFPCDSGCRPVEPTSTQMIHDAVTGTSYLAGIAALLILGIQARHWPGGRHLLPLGVACGAVAAVAAICMASLAPDSDHVGLVQRAFELCMGTWIVACAFHVRRDPRVSRGAEPS